MCRFIVNAVIVRRSEVQCRWFFGFCILTKKSAHSRQHNTRASFSVCCVSSVGGLPRGWPLAMGSIRWIRVRSPATGEAGRQPRIEARRTSDFGLETGGVPVARVPGTPAAGIFFFFFMEHAISHVP